MASVVLFLPIPVHRFHFLYRGHHPSVEKLVILEFGNRQEEPMQVNVVDAVVRRQVKAETVFGLTILRLQLFCAIFSHAICLNC